MAGLWPLIITLVWEAESDTDDCVYHTSLGQAEAKGRKDARPCLGIQRTNGVSVSWRHAGFRARKKEEIRVWLE